MNRFAPAASVIAICLGVVLIAGVRPATPADDPRPTVAAHTISPEPVATAAATASAAAASAATASAATATPPIAPGYRIRIPRLEIELPIAEGDLERDAVRQETPENFAFHLPGTGVPGDGSNSYFYAHARRGMFLSLWDARHGDEVWITTPDGRALRYVVREVHPRVDPTDVSWAARTPGERLTLQTSTGPDPGDPRFVVVALPA